MCGQISYLIIYLRQSNEPSLFNFQFFSWLGHRLKRISWRLCSEDHHYNQKRLNDTTDFVGSYFCNALLFHHFPLESVLNYKVNVYQSWPLSECTIGWINVPVNSKTAHPPGQSPGIWLALSSVQWGIWLKMRPARWGIWLSCQNVCQRSEAKGFRNSLIQHVSRVHGSLLLSIPRGFFCCCRFI